MKAVAFLQQNFGNDTTSGLSQPGSHTEAMWEGSEPGCEGQEQGDITVRTFTQHPSIYRDILQRSQVSKEDKLCGCNQFLRTWTQRSKGNPKLPEDSSIEY